MDSGLFKYGQANGWTDRNSCVCYRTSSPIRYTALPTPRFDTTTYHLASSIQSYICTCEQIEYTNDKKNHGKDFQRLGQAFWGLCKGLCQAVIGLIMFTYAGS